MIIALLFLILFAILFPKALRFLFALLFIGGIMLLGEVHAKSAKTKTGFCVGDYSLKDVNGQFVATPLMRGHCRKITIKKGTHAEGSTARPCWKIKNGADVSLSEIDRLALALKGKVYGSDCAVGNYIAAECKIHSAMSVGLAINALTHKAIAGEALPDIPACGA